MQLNRCAFARSVLVLAGVVFATCTFAAGSRSEASPSTRNDSRVTAANGVRARLLELPRSGNTAPRGDAHAKDLEANAYRAYPPSCLSYPLPTDITGPHWSRSVDLYEVDGNGADSLETVTITIWRVACSSSQFYTSATLMRIDRQRQFNGDNTIFPRFPDVRAAQVNEYDDIAFDGGIDYVRVAPEANTVVSDSLPDTPLVYSTTYVLENYPSPLAGRFDFNLPFTIRFDNGYASNNQFFIDVPGYDPTASTYPAAFESLPINGYLSSNWFDPAHGGEGIITQIAEFPPAADGTVFKQLVFDWFTFDNDGLPFWISGNATINASNPTSVTVPAVYLTNGGFAGDFGANATANPWGTVTFEFPDCNHLTVTYASNGSQPSFVPTGSGTLNLQRLVSVNGLTCE